MNNDGKQDIVVARTWLDNAMYSSVGWFERLASPTVLFSQHQLIEQHFVDDFSYINLASADIDNDNDLDLVIAFRHSQGVQAGWYQQQSNGQYSSKIIIDTNVEFYANGRAKPDLLVFDSNNDGQLDISVWPSHIDTKLSAYMYLNQGDGADFSKSAELLNLDASFDTHHIIDIKVAHLNGDNWPDLVVMRKVIGSDIYYREGALDVYLGSGEAWFNVQTVDVGSNAGAISIADLDQDGDNDILFSMTQWSGSPAYLAWMENTDGQASWQKTILAYPGNLFNLDVNDIDGDQRPDVLVRDHDVVGWMRNQMF
jgi:hypothetical protein